jgi:TatD DNase family protein
VLIDTHNHLDAREFDSDRAAVVARAAAAGVRMIVIPAVERANFARVRELAAEHNFVYALGIHPLFTPNALDSDLDALRSAATEALADPHFVAIGEIGLDFFVPSLKEGAARAKQEHFYLQQLHIARELGLPVLLHVRRSQDILLKHLRRVRVQGIAHAFNGSDQQAQAFIELGFKLGFGGQATFPRALQIRRLWAQLPAECLLLETDAPDIAPRWAYRERNEPAHLARIAAELAPLRGLNALELTALTTRNARAVLPRLDTYLSLLEL